MSFCDFSGLSELFTFTLSGLNKELGSRSECFDLLSDDLGENTFLMSFDETLSESPDETLVIVTLLEPTDGNLWSPSLGTVLHGKIVTLESLDGENREPILLPSREETLPDPEDGELKCFLCFILGFTGDMPLLTLFLRSSENDDVVWSGRR